VIYFCAQQNRRALVLQSPGLNGIDFLEVSDEDGPEGCGTRLLLTLLKDARPLGLGPSEILVTGGEPLSQIPAIDVVSGTAGSPRVVVVDLERTGDFAPYTLRLVAGPQTNDPPDGLDPALASVAFSFKAGCPTVGDCAPETCCPPVPAAVPDLNYLAKDYDGFRQVMLDRMAVLTPWTETHPSDLGIMLVELLAYAADHLSYRQDAAATEAYLGTARSRISLRRHVKLVDYTVDDGANARAWLFVRAAPGAGGTLLPAGTTVYTRVPGLPVSITPGTRAAETLAQNGAVAFETLADLWLYPELNEIAFYTWSDANCCLAPGATEATLEGTLTSLATGAVLVFEEVCGPQTGDPGDADPAKRWAVRLTGVRCTDYKNRVLVDPLNGQAVTRVTWDAADAPPFPLCLSSTTDAAHGSRALAGVSVARGNVVAADHGMWDGPEDLGEVPPAPPAPVLETSCRCRCGTAVAPIPPRPRYYPRLSQSPLTFARSFDPAAPASASVPPPPGASSGAARAVPQLEVVDDQGQPWTVLDDLLSSDGLARVCVVEVERDGSAFLRFGDGQYGAAPETGTSFQARYRVGGGSAGNVGRDVLAHALTAVPGIVEIRNPIAAAGGADPETMEHIRQIAPSAFRTQLRAVTEDDYGTMAALDPAVREARGTLRWTGAWYTAFVSLDAATGGSPAASLVEATANRLNLLRMAGVDLQVEGAVVVGLRIEMAICVDGDHFQNDVEAALLRLFVAGDPCTGAPGVLAAANFTFGQTIYTSPLAASAQDVDGVASATVTVFQRMTDPSIDGAAAGYLAMGRLELPRCDNDPNRLDHGILVLHMEGGK
jgi:hypothetical protein